MSRAAAGARLALAYVVRASLVLVASLVGLAVAAAPARADEDDLDGPSLEVGAGVSVIYPPENGAIVATVPLSLAINGFLPARRLGVRAELSSFENKTRGDEIMGVHLALEDVWNRRRRGYAGYFVGVLLLIPPPGHGDLTTDRGVTTGLRFAGVLHRRDDLAVRLVLTARVAFFGDVQPVFDAGLSLAWEAS